jgi:hypothetical protein
MVRPGLPGRTPLAFLALGFLLYRRSETTVAEQGP